MHAGIDSKRGSRHVCQADPPIVWTLYDYIKAY